MRQVLPHGAGHFDTVVEDRLRENGHGERKGRGQQGRDSACHERGSGHCIPLFQSGGLCHKHTGDGGTPACGDDGALELLDQAIEGEVEKLVRMEELLHSRVVGQDDAVTAIANAIRRSREGDQPRPMSWRIERGGRPMDLVATPRLVDEGGQRVARLEIGVGSAPERVFVSHGLLDGLWRGASQSWDMAATTVRLADLPGAGTQPIARLTLNDAATTAIEQLSAAPRSAVSLGENVAPSPCGVSTDTSRLITSVATPEVT